MAAPPIWFLGTFVLVGVVMVAAGVFVLGTWLRLRRSSTREVRSITGDGPVEVAGRARVIDSEGTLTAPITGTEALCYTYKVERYRHDDDGSDWRTVDSGEGTVPFLVEDDTGTIRVEPEHADLLLSKSRRTTYGSDANLPGPLAAFVDGNDSVRTSGSISVGPLDISLGGRYRYTEYRLDPDEQVYVAGHARYAPGVEGVGQVKAVLGPSDSAISGASWLRRKVGSLSEFPFVVADSGEKGGQRRLLKRGLIYLGFGLVFGGMPMLFLL